MNLDVDPGREYYNAKIETAPYEELDKIQIRRLHEVVKYAYDNCSFYHRRWKRLGVKPEDIVTLDDFRRKIPPFTKDDLRKESSADDITGGITSSSKIAVKNYAMTSGTTGVNTFIGLSAGFIETFVDVLFLREFWMAKLRPKMRVFHIPAGWHFFGIGQNIVLTKMGVICLSSWGTMFHKFIPNMMNAIRSLKPDYFIGLPWVISELIDEAYKTGIEPKKLFAGVKYMSLAGQPLTPGLRKKILAETNVSDVFESGGSVDGLWGGGDCYAHEGHHTWMDHNFLEVVDVHSLDPVEDEDRGEMISTNIRLGGPLYIRFRGDDLVHKVKERCTCGRTHERVEIYDRLTNCFKVNSRILTPYDISRIIEDVCGYRLFTIVNPDESSEKLRIRIAKGEESSNDHLGLEEELDKVANKKFGVSLTVEWVDPKRLPFVHRKLLQVIKKEQN